MTKVLVSDPIDQAGIDILSQVATVDVRTGLPPEELKAIIADYDGLMIRSGTTVTAEIIEAAHKLRIIVAGDEPGSQRLLESLTAALPETVIVACQDHACPAWGCGPLIAGTHGFLHVDQVPSNLPWISGTEVPRILGILTPGAASRYRSLLIEMSDYRPPVMTLRDAV